MSNSVIGTYNGMTIAVEEHGTPNGVFDAGERIGIAPSSGGAFVFDTATVDSFLRTLGVGGMSSTGETFSRRPGADLGLLRDYIDRVNDRQTGSPQNANVPQADSLEGER